MMVHAILERIIHKLSLATEEKSWQDTLPTQPRVSTLSCIRIEI